ncbi:MAG: galactokinase [Gemmatimonadota bacterium]
MRSTRRFRELFGAVPAAAVRVPGRVNLIGEHIDYAGLPVLPMAIERGITLVVGSRSDGRVRVVNSSAEHGEREFAVERAIPPWPAGDWGNYPKAAVQGLVEAGYGVAGFDAVIDSDLPQAAGLASSSALVVAIALGALAVAGGRAEAAPLELAALLARAEHYVGARGGGMDQAAILASRAGFASHVEFEPLRVAWIPVPDDWAFVVAHSLTTAEKSGAARETYNARRAQVERALELDGEGRELPAALRPRLRHVVSEAERVGHAVAALRSADIDAFGRLMLASHESLRADFEVSAPALDALVRDAMAAGAVGARLTGAGLGGCVLALVPASTLDGFLERLHTAFYEPRGLPPGGGRRDYLFAVRPGPGATVARI